MIFRRKKKAFALDAVAFENWIRAHRPPIEWFVGLDPITQKGLADIGDGVTFDTVSALADAMSNAPALTAGHGASGQSEALQAANAILEGMRRRASTQPDPEPKPPAAPTGPVSMSEAPKVRAEREARRQATKNEGRSLLGQKPDPVT